MTKGTRCHFFSCIAFAIRVCGLFTCLYTVGQSVSSHWLATYLYDSRYYVYLNFVHSQICLLSLPLNTFGKSAPFQVRELSLIHAHCRRTLACYRILYRQCHKFFSRSPYHLGTFAAYQ